MMPDVLALPLAQAELALGKAGYRCEVRRTQPRYRRHQVEGGMPAEYVVNQRMLDNHIVVLTTVIRYRKEVLQDGFRNQ